jgi:hypothetical protein
MLALKAKSVLPLQNPETLEKLDPQINKKGREMSAIREEMEFKKKVMRDFGEHARSNFKPKVSNKLVYELANRKESLSKKNAISPDIKLTNIKSIDYVRDWRANKNIVVKAREEME